LSFYNFIKFKIVNLERINFLLDKTQQIKSEDIKILTKTWLIGGVVSFVDSIYLKS